MVGASNSKLVRRLIVACIVAAALFSAVVVLGSSSTQYGVQHTIQIEPGSTTVSESFSFNVGPLSSWRNHVFQIRCEYACSSSAENLTNLHVTVKADLMVNGAEAEGFTHYIDAFQGSFSEVYGLTLPHSLLRLGENNVALILHIEAEGRIDPATEIELVFSSYRIKTI